MWPCVIHTCALSVLDCAYLSKQYVFCALLLCDIATLLWYIYPHNKPILKQYIYFLSPTLPLSILRFLCPHILVVEAPPVRQGPRYLHIFTHFWILLPYTLYHRSSHLSSSRPLGYSRPSILREEHIYIWLLHISFIESFLARHPTSLRDFIGCSNARRQKTTPKRRPISSPRAPRIHLHLARARDTRTLKDLRESRRRSIFCWSYGILTSILSVLSSFS